jgi:hypothetical protein
MNWPGELAACAATILSKRVIELYPDAYGSPSMVMFEFIHERFISDD